MANKKKQERPECPWDVAERQPAKSEAEITGRIRKADAAMRQLAKACDYENADRIGWQI